MTDKITFPIDSQVNGKFSEVKSEVSRIIKNRLCSDVADLYLKTVDKVLAVSDSTYIFSFVDGVILVIKAEIVNGLPIVQIVSEDGVLATTEVRQKILSENVEINFAAKKKSAEEIQKAELKRAAIAKLTPEELVALGLGSLT
jgi:hypothetical protein